jgi:hypothetical protein
MLFLSRAVRSVLAAAVLLATASSVATADEMAPMKMPPGMTPAIMKMMMTPGKPHPAGLPAGVMPQMGCIPSMGFHYAKAKDWPFGPIYGYYNGKPVFTEIMVAATKFASGSSWDEELKPLPGYTINHVDIWYEAHGHPGYLVPHYDIHAWYIPHAQHMTFCGNTSGKKPAFM